MMLLFDYPSTEVYHVLSRFLAENAAGCGSPGPDPGNSVNLQIMGKSMLAVSVDKFHLLVSVRNQSASCLVALVFVAAIIAVLYWFFGTELGCAIRATGANSSVSINTDTMKIVGLILSNGLVGRSDRLTTLMITHNMRDAIEYGDRLLMMYSGRIVVDVSGEEKKNLTVEQLLNLFSQASGSDGVNDKLVLS